MNTNNTHKYIVWLRCYSQKHPVKGWLLALFGCLLGCFIAFIAVLLFYRVIKELLYDHHVRFRNYGLILAAFIAGGIAIWRGFIADQENRTNRQRLEVEERGRIVDRIGTATTNMRANHGDDPQKPNIQARIEGIYALESISQDNPNYHIRMMDNITEYIRENAPKKSYRTTPRADIKIAIDVLARRDAARIEQENAKDYKLDLRSTYLQGVVVQSGGNFNNAQLQGAIFAGAQLEGIDFSRAQLEGADFLYAQLQGANFTGAQLQGANFIDAQLQRANFVNAQLQRAKFRDAQLQGAYFGGVKLYRADFRNAQLEGAVFGCNDLRETKNLTPDQLQQSFGDGSVKLPDGLTPPNHWPKATPDWDDYEAKYKQWLQSTYPDLYKQRYGQ